MVNIFFTLKFPWETNVIQFSNKNRKGFLYAGSLFVLASVGSIFNHAFLRQMVIVGVQVRRF